jgi:hypothetical protein
LEAGFDLAADAELRAAFGEDGAGAVFSAGAVCGSEAWDAAAKGVGGALSCAAESALLGKPHSIANASTHQLLRPTRTTFLFLRAEDAIQNLFCEPQGLKPVPFRALIGTSK